MLEKRFAPIDGRNLEIIETVMSCPEVSALADELKFKIRLCVEEVEENILCYSGSTWIDLKVAAENGTLSISFCDGGMKFNPLDRDDPDVQAPLEERGIGGLGIFLCKSMMDYIDYSYKDGRNCLVMKKKIA